jgi:hypothetical protein
MLFDAGLLFFHAGATFGFTAGEFVSLAGFTNSGSSASSVINLGNPRDLGIGPGQEIPQIAIVVGTAFTGSSASFTINAQFQGSTDSVTWTTYVESGANTTASYAAGANILPIAVPRRPAGAALPLYYRVNLVAGGAGATTSISTGTVIGGIVLTRDDGPGTLASYPSGFQVS